MKVSSNHGVSATTGNWSKQTLQYTYKVYQCYSVSSTESWQISVNCGHGTPLIYIEYNFDGLQKYCLNINIKILGKKKDRFLSISPVPNHITYHFDMCTITPHFLLLLTLTSLSWKQRQVPVQSYISNTLGHTCPAPSVGKTYVNSSHV